MLLFAFVRFLNRTLVKDDFDNPDNNNIIKEQNVVDWGMHGDRRVEGGVNCSSILDGSNINQSFTLTTNLSICINELSYYIE